MAIMSALSKAPIIPVSMIGTFELWPKQQKFPKIKKIITITFGNKIPALKKITLNETKKYMNKIMNTIAKLCKKRYNHYEH